MHTAYWRESQKEGDHCEDQDVDVFMILKLILSRDDGLTWTAMIWLRIETSRGLL
jgi:hypothetical protein